MNYPSWIMAAVGLLSLANSILVAWAIWSIKRIAEDKAKEIAAPLAGDIGQIEDRLTRIEGSLEHLPTADEYRSLLVQMTEMKGDMRVLTTGLTGASDLFVRLERKVDVIDGFLRNEGTK